MSLPPTILEEVSDPAVLVGSQAQLGRFRRNSDWLQAHWKQLLPAAHGKHVAVAGQQAFIAETAAEAWSLAAAAHPEDDASFRAVRFPSRRAAPVW